jgi:hypothetical protein
VVDEHARSDQEISPKSKSMSLSRARRQTLFGEPLLLEGEDPAAYDDLLGEVRAAVKPADIIDEMFTVDVVSLQWEVLRWRRLKLSVIRNLALEKLEKFLREELHDDLYRDYFVDDLAELLEDNLPDEQAASARTLAQQYARNEEHAVEEVVDILLGLNLEKILNNARERKLKELMKDYARRESAAVALIHELLIGAGKSIDDLVAERLGGALDYVERIDHLTVIAESRRNAILREIDRRRPLLAETLRHTVQQIESDELEVIETTPAKGENAA